MTPSDIAHQYLRYWPVSESPADNAPVPLWLFIKAHPDLDRQMIRQALTVVETKGSVKLPKDDVIMTWFGCNPTAIPMCDQVLKAKARPKSFTELLQRAYRAAVMSVVTEVYEFINKQITS